MGNKSTTRHLNRNDTAQSVAAKEFSNMIGASNIRDAKNAKPIQPIRQKFVNALGRWKARMSYASGWLSIVGIPFLIVSTFQSMLFRMNIDVPFIPLFIASVLLLVFFAWFIDKIGIMESETNYSMEKSVAIRSIKK